MNAPLLVLLASTTLSSAPTVSRPMSFFELKTNRLDGTPVALAEYKGKVVLVVNTASRCGHTPQYEGLQALHAALEKKGLVVMGFPSNDFGKQEPGTAEEIRKFCSLQYNVTFPMMEKVKTKGEGQSPVYAFLTRKHDVPSWNFHKFLVGRDGRVRAAFSSATQPDDEALRAAIDAALAEKP